MMSSLWLLDEKVVIGLVDISIVCDNVFGSVAKLPSFAITTLSQDVSPAST